KAAASSAPSAQASAAAPAEATPAPASVASAPPVTPMPPVSPPSTPSTPVTPAQPVAPVANKAVYHADVRFGTTEQPPLVRDAKRLTAFPTSFEPVAVYLGVLRGGWGAAFALRDGAQPVGNAACRPRKP